jgi:SAM-dependent methyltransferase
VTDRRRRKALKAAILRSRLPLKGKLARAYLRSCELRLSLSGGGDRRTIVNGLAVPPRRLRVLVAGTPDLERFLRSGEAQASYLRELLVQIGRPLQDIDSILDFGCGCARITRWFSDLAHTRIDGCDYNIELVDWCNANIPFIRARATKLQPPMPYQEKSFDFLYAFSVFTHLSAELAREWMTELRRVIKPGGLLWFTLHGESYRERLLPEEKARFDAGEIVVWLPEVQGTNLCGAYWPEASVRRMLGEGFELLSHFDPRVDPDTAERIELAHDAYLARRL